LGQRQLVWVDRAGKPVAPIGAPGLFEHVELSPDGKRVAVDRVDEQSNKRDVWLMDIATQTPTRFTFDPDQYSVARWSADGSRLIFPRVGNRKGIYQKLSTGAGAEEQILPSPHDGLLIADDVSANGRFMVLVEYPPGLRSRLSLLPTSGDRRLVPVPNSDVAGANGRFSPDGRWLAYQSAESGRSEVYVQPFPASGAKWQISRDGGGRPRWRRDGKELYFIAAGMTLMAAPIAAGEDFHSGVPAPIFPLRYIGPLAAQYPYDVSADGQRFLVIAADQDQQMTPVTVLLNWRPRLP
jgi:Tol biopolymer transport system component